MPTITSVKQQKNKKRVNVYLDGKFGFGLDLETFMKLGLKVEEELTEKEIEEIVKKSEFQKTLDKLYKFAMVRPRSSKEFENWMKRKKVHESIRNDLFNRLKRLELVDDEKFAKWWVEQRINFRPKPKRVLYKELLQKGVGKNIIKATLSESEIDEVAIAKKELNKKEYKWKKFKGYQKRLKMSEFLARKGFGWDVVKEAVKDSFDV